MFKFDLEFRIKAVKVGKIRLYGSDDKSTTKCLFVYTFYDYVMVFYDFDFNVNIKHLTFKRSMEKLNNKIHPRLSKRMF